MSDSKKNWDQFQSDMSNLGGSLREAFRTAPTGSARTELQDAIDRLEEAAGAVFKSIDHIAQDPEVRAGSRKAARSFGAALSETFRDLGDDVASAVRSRKPRN